MVWYTLQMDSLFKNLADKDLATLRTVGALENSLANQKGFVSYYFTDGNPEWLKKLEDYRLDFAKQLDKVKESVQVDGDRLLVGHIEHEYTEYIRTKDKVIGYYKAGKKAPGLELHQEARIQFLKILELCDQYTEICDEKQLNYEVSQFSKRGEKVKACKDFREMLDDKEIDAVSITTPNHWQ